jgi:hypothetical protein
MIEQIVSFANELKDHQVSPLIRLLLNFLFVGGISSFIFIEFYFDYELLDISDYKGYFRFFINGEFIVPLGIFFIMWNVTRWISFLLFKFPNFIMGVRLRNAILRFSFLKTMPEQKLIEAEISIAKAESISKDEILAKIFLLVKKRISRVDFRKLRRNADRVQTNLENEFTVLVRAFIATTIYFSTVAHFGWLLLVVLYVTILIIAILLFIGYHLAEVLPIVLDKAIIEIDKIYKR